MWRRSISLPLQRPFSTSPEIQTLYSFLQPSVFALKKTPLPPPKPQNLRRYL
uniref:Uncharacterized protein n=1 Tax=Nelumbo nucifera TaxID=4432 RepID=A0A822YBG9_NELNU|nr:TPA_asm: hypothetical protein HUJ06_010305 [Nelumbo nucifera]